MWFWRKICGLYKNFIELIGEKTAGLRLKALYAFNNIGSKKKEKDK